MAVPGMGNVQVSFARDDSGPTADARKARRELDDRIRSKLDSILTKEQRERLPKDQQPGEGGHMMVPGDGGEAAVGTVIIKQDR